MKILYCTVFRKACIKTAVQVTSARRWILKTSNLERFFYDLAGRDGVNFLDAPFEGQEGLDLGGALLHDAREYGFTLDRTHDERQGD